MEVSDKKSSIPFEFTPIIWVNSGIRKNKVTLWKVNDFGNCAASCFVLFTTTEFFRELLYFFHSSLRCSLDTSCTGIQYRRQQAEVNCAIINRNGVELQTFVTSDEREIYEKDLINLLLFLYLLKEFFGGCESSLRGHWYSCFGPLTTSALGLSLACIRYRLHAMDSSDSPLNATPACISVDNMAAQPF